MLVKTAAVDEAAQLWAEALEYLNMFNDVYHTAQKTKSLPTLRRGLRKLSKGDTPIYSWAKRAIPSELYDRVYLPVSREPRALSKRKDASAEEIKDVLEALKAALQAFLAASSPVAKGLARRWLNLRDQRTPST